jgi:hypothetical protein
MATHLTPADLSHFLRSRKSHNAKVMADWVDDNPESGVTEGAVNLLEKYVRRLANTIEMKTVAMMAANEVHGTDVPYNMPVLNGLRMSSVLRLVAHDGRYDTTKQGHVWDRLCVAATLNGEPKLPGWTGQLVKYLTTGGVPITNKRKPDDGRKEYTVEFLLVKRITVREGDEIQAEWEAAKKLTDKQKRACRKYRVVDADDNALFDWALPNLQEWGVEEGK